MRERSQFATVEPFKLEQVSRNSIHDSQQETNRCKKSRIVFAPSTLLDAPCLLGEVRGPVDEVPFPKCEHTAGDAAEPLANLNLHNTARLGLPGGCQCCRGCHGCPEGLHDPLAGSRSTSD